MPFCVIVDNHYILSTYLISDLMNLSSLLFNHKQFFNPMLITKHIFSKIINEMFGKNTINVFRC